MARWICNPVNVLVATILVGCAATVGMQQTPRKHAGSTNSGKDNLMPTDAEILINCRVMTARDLFAALKLPMTHAAADRVYVVGDLRNTTTRTAYAKIGIDIRGKDFRGNADVTVGMIPPNGRHSEPFLCKVRNIVRETTDVTEFTIDTHVIEVKYK